MSRFVELLSNTRACDPASVQRSAAENLSGCICGSHLTLWSEDASVPATGKYAVLGVASYSVSDLELLDELDSAATKGKGYRVDVFDVLGCKTMNDFDRRIPGVGNVYQSPVVGIWLDGELAVTATGIRAGRNALERHGFL